MHSPTGRERQETATIFGVSMKHLSLVVLLLQNSVLVLMMRFSRVSVDPDQPMYLASTAVFIAEIIKLCTCFMIIVYRKRSLSRTITIVRQEIIGQPQEILKMLVPSGLYALQNNLLYIALSNLEAATFQVTYQMKILSTAIFSVVMLNRRLTRQKWLSLCLLMVGVTLVQLQNVGTGRSPVIVDNSQDDEGDSEFLSGGVGDGGSDTADALVGGSEDDASQNPIIGLLAVLTSCVSSGFAGCYFEKILKGSESDMWVRNLQLGISGSLFSFLAMFYDRQRIYEGGIFQGYSMITWMVITNQALGGLLVAIVVKYADNILKGFATSLSIIVSGMISVYFFDFEPSLQFQLGTLVVILATFLYGRPDAPIPRFVRRQKKPILLFANGTLSYPFKNMTSQPHQLSQRPSRPPSHPTQATATFPSEEDTPPSSPTLDPVKDDPFVCGWLVDRETLETKLIVRKGHPSTIGRFALCDLVLAEDTVSTFHCKLFVDTSSNGTYWNGHLIGKGESVVLSQGDVIRIRIGHFFIFHASESARLDHYDPDIWMVDKSYRILPHSLGKGTYAKVNVAVHRKTQVQLAVKIMDRIRYDGLDITGGMNIDKEIAILQAVAHANIVPVVDVIKTVRYAYVFMQMFLGGDLFDYLLSERRLSELESKFITYQVLLALQHLKSKNILHRDIKPENLLLASATKYPRILLADFGLASEYNDGRRLKTVCGTYAYMAPEVLNAKRVLGAGYGNAADCWSLGITLYAMLSGMHPFTSVCASETEKTMRRKIRECVLDFSSSAWNGISSAAREVIEGLLEIDPSQRWSIEDVLLSKWIQMDAPWIRQRYRETVLTHWTKSCQSLEPVAQQSESTDPDMRVWKRARTEQSLTEVEDRSPVPTAGRSTPNAEERANKRGCVSAVSSPVECVPNVPSFSPAEAK
ncbi:hypothetical protein BGZ98_001038 [Dissophora globulifera]|nr:hypothetical protein BGZ98_001038 [Dissophora globulifera]